MVIMLTERPQMAEFLVGHGVVGATETATMEPLSGGVSSDIWLIHSAGAEFVVKQPLIELKVDSEWKAPLARSASEANWLRTIGVLVPGACPRILAFDADTNFIAMEYLDGRAHRLWKTELLAGRTDVEFAAAVGETVGTIHEDTSARVDLAERFATDDLFFALRIEPYFLRLLDSHPDLAGRVETIVRSTMENKRVLVHGDVSPKNILIGPRGPVFLDAETAWWGDPAFDVAFCVNHLLLKSLNPLRNAVELVDASEALIAAYMRHVVWESPTAVAERIACLLPLLLLARVDGRSPVDYLDPAEQAVVRGFAIARIQGEEQDLPQLLADWKELTT